MMIASLLLSWLLALCPIHGTQTRESAAELSVVPSTVETVEGSPVRLSEAKRLLLRPASIPDGSQEFVVRGEVRVENTSGRAIRRLNLSFCYGGMTMAVAVDLIGASEVRDYVNDKFHVKGGPAPNDQTLTLTVRPRGAQFEDGTHWAAPRALLSRLVTQSLRQSGSPLTIRKCDFHDDTFTASLSANTFPQIVAYKLGAVKDTPDTFDVRLGKWVTLSQDDSAQGHILTFTDASESLVAHDLPTRESNTRTLSDGRVITESFGVAIFVAEVRFANGRVWRQDLTRDALFWDN